MQFGSIINEHNVFGSGDTIKGDFHIIKPSSTWKQWCTIIHVITNINTNEGRKKCVEAAKIFYRLGITI